MKKFVSVLCSVCLILFLADAGLSLLDDSLTLGLGLHVFSVVRALAFLVFIPVALATYVMIGVTPMVPKRWFLPIVFFAPAAFFGLLLFAIYHFDLAPQAAWFISLAEVLLGLWILYRAQGKLTVRWPLVPEAQLGNKVFGWVNLLGFLFGNVFVLAPAVLVYLAFCAILAVDHLTQGFLKLQSDGLVARAKTYVRDDGKTILLMPMMHMAEPDFYAQVTKSFPPHSAILLEGVSDNEHLMEYKLDYSRVATSLGLCSQKEEFTPSADGNVEVRRADVDVDVFSKPTLEMLNLVARLYSNGLDPVVLKQLSQKSKDPNLQEEIMTDILVKRNEHLLGEIQSELRRSNLIVVPWGAAHMPGISAEIEKEGFHLTRTQEFKILNFRTVADALASKKE